jgi:hypothetical protein
MTLLHENTVVMSPASSHDATVRTSVAAHADTIARRIDAAR